MTIKARHNIQHRQICSRWVEEMPLPSILKRVYSRRPLTQQSELDKQINDLADYQTLHNIDTAVKILAQALEQQQLIMIVGDFDADGATSTAVVIRALQAFGHHRYTYLVPNRFDFGYGLTPELVEVAVQAADADIDNTVLITVDSGINCLKGVSAARAAGFKVIVTDHHLPGPVLPDAHAIINPNQCNDTFPSKAIAGVGVAFYVMLALRAYLRQQQWFEKHRLEQPNLADLLGLVALGTIADVVPLDHTNRILVEQGLQRIRKGRCAPGILALLKIAQRDYRNTIASDIGFAVAPRLNAAGRLQDMSVGIECLLSNHPEQAEKFAIQLDQINNERRDIERDMSQQAMVILEDLLSNIQEQRLPAALVLYDASWHQGVVGVVASRIKERVHRPVIVFARVSDTELKGSARSIKDVHIRDILERIHTLYPGLISKFGGHAMAAGLSLPIEHIERFQQVLSDVVAALAVENLGQASVYTDGVLDATELTLQNAQLLREAGPWGQAFPEPVFDGIFQLHNYKILKDAHLKMILSPEGSQTQLDAIAFNTLPDWQQTIEKLHIVYRLNVNTFRGVNNVQMLVEHLEPI